MKILAYILTVIVALCILSWGYVIPKMIAVNTAIPAVVAEEGPTALKATWYDPLHNYCGSFPAPKEIHDEQKVRLLYKALRDLPELPPQEKCPEDNGLMLHMEFLNKDALVDKAEVNLTGCTNVHIGNKSLYRADLVEDEIYYVLEIDKSTLPNERGGNDCR